MTPMIFSELSTEGRYTGNTARWIDIGTLLESPEPAKALARDCNCAANKAAKGLGYTTEEDRAEFRAAYLHNVQYQLCRALSLESSTNPALIRDWLACAGHTYTVDQVRANADASARWIARRLGFGHLYAEHRSSTVH